MPNSSQREYNVDRNGAFNVWMANSVVLQKRAWISIAVANLNREVVLVQRDARKRLAALGNGGDGEVLWGNLSAGRRFKIVYRMAGTTIRTQEVVAQLGAGGGGRTGKQSGSMIYDACRSPTVVRSRRDFLKRPRE